MHLECNANKMNTIKYSPCNTEVLLGKTGENQIHRDKKVVLVIESSWGCGVERSFWAVRRRPLWWSSESHTALDPWIPGGGTCPVLLGADRSAERAHVCPQEIAGVWSQRVSKQDNVVY